jgi:hypothetical protein
MTLKYYITIIIIIIIVVVVVFVVIIIVLPCMFGTRMIFYTYYSPRDASAL